MKFERYPFLPAIHKNLNKLGWIRPTDIQFKAIPPVLNGEDVLAIAQTGTGKTAAFAIPVCDAVARMKKHPGSKRVQCLVMVPTRELADQISTVVRQISMGTGLRILNIMGGVPQNEQVSALEKGVDILVSTPGRMFDLIAQGHLLLDRIQILVIDEADRMLDLGFLKDIKDVLRHVPKKRQTLFFSATINDKIRKLAYSIVKNAIRIQISPENPVNKNIEHSVAFIEMDDKRFFLERMIHEFPEKKILVFVRTRVRAERVHLALKRAGIDSETLHGAKEQQERLKTLGKFRDGSVRTLIATDVTARGIDIQGVDTVVNYDLPELPENYVHRIGRTGRGKKKGLAFSFCSPQEQPLLSAIEEYIGSAVRKQEISHGLYEETISFSSDESAYNWKKLMEEDEENSAGKKKTQSKRR